MSQLPDPGAALARITEVLEGALPASVHAVGGAFNASELRRHVTAAPTVLVACLGLTDFARRGASAWMMAGEWAVYVLTRDTAIAPRDRIALTLAAEVLRCIYRTTWGDADTFEVPDEDSITATNLYGGELDNVACALWAVTWRQGIKLPAA